MAKLAFSELSNQIDMLSYADRIRLLDKIVRTLHAPMKVPAKKLPTLLLRSAYGKTGMCLWNQSAKRHGGAHNALSVLIEQFTKSHGLLIPDALIAATALELALPLYTANLKDFRYIPDLLLV